MGQLIPGEHPRFVKSGFGKSGHSLEGLPHMLLTKRLEEQLDLVDDQLFRQLYSFSTRSDTASLPFSRSAMTADDWDDLIMLGYLVAQREAIVSALQGVLEG